MTENEAKAFLEIEKQCINRNCDRNCEKCDIVQKVEDLNSAYGTAIKALEEVQQYREIGTPEECQAAMETQIAKKAITYRGTNRADCPACGATVRGIDAPFGNWCSKCGQRLDWEEEK